MEWKKYPENKPEKPGVIIVKINESHIFCRVVKFSLNNEFKSEYDEIFYELENKDYNPFFVSRGWVKPSHFAEVQYWIEFPEFPKENNSINEKNNI